MHCMRELVGYEECIGYCDAVYNNCDVMLTMKAIFRPKNTNALAATDGNDGERRHTLNMITKLFIYAMLDCNCFRKTHRIAE